MTGRLDGKVAVITGAASGIGAGTARCFVDEGASVVIADLQEEAGGRLADELGAAARFVLTDVTSEDDVAAAVDLAVRDFARLDVMFNNAGVVGVVGSVAEMPVESFDHTMAILLRGVFLGTKHAARVMIEQGSGVILNTASTAGVVGGLGPHVYTAAKHGVIGLTRSVANELAPHGIRVNAIAPGNTVTAMTAAVMTGDHADVEQAADHIGAMSPLGYPGYPEDVAAAAVYLASDDGRYVSGHTLVVDAGQTAAGTSPNRFNLGRPRQYHEAGRIT